MEDFFLRCQEDMIKYYHISVTIYLIFYFSKVNMRHPSYSINGILGIQQADANDNLMKRKRDDEGKKRLRMKERER